MCVGTLCFDSRLLKATYSITFTAFVKPVKAFWPGMLLGSAKFVTFWYPKSNRYAVPRGHLCDCSSVKFHSGNPDGSFLGAGREFVLYFSIFKWYLSFLQGILLNM